MSNILSKQDVLKKRLLIIFFVLFSLFLSEKVYALKHWTPEYVVITRSPLNYVLITIEVYDYSFGPNSEHGYLEWCRFEASADGMNYYRLLEISTPRQSMSTTTMINMQNKLDIALIRFLNNVDNIPAGSIWPSNLNLKILVSNCKDIAILSLGWYVNKPVAYLRLSVKWRVEGQKIDYFTGIIYKIDAVGQSMLKSHIPESDTVKLFKESEAIVIKGAELVSNIKVYTTSGVEIKSVISNNDVVKIKLPAKQIYIVHIGKSRYKVAM